MDRIILFGGKPSYTCELLRNLAYSKFDCHMVCGSFSTLFSAVEEREFDTLVYIVSGDGENVSEAVCGVRERCPHINIILIVNSSFRSVCSTLDTLDSVEFIFLPCSMIDTVNAVRSIILRPLQDLREKLGQRNEVEKYLLGLGYAENCSGFRLLCYAIEIGLKFPQVLKSSSPRFIYSMLAVGTSRSFDRISRNFRRFLRIIRRSLGIFPPKTTMLLSTMCSNFVAVPP